MRYTYCTTSQPVVEAVSILKCCSEIILDTEGKDIGSTDGALSIISAGMHDAGLIFLFDFFALCPSNSPTNIEPLLNLLSSPSHVKLIWDGRHDNVELSETFGCRLVRVLDFRSRSSCRGGKSARREKKKEYSGYKRATLDSLLSGRSLERSKPCISYRECKSASRCLVWISEGKIRPF
ncbi:hypothetical protein BDV98DRAFT_569511 [Pterulicium gracile]|uniref:3'-5' exonuclease domain-containing protein n=1 Tax=Pterulicium gracile TaxID=1884261 RepID=A0A5C3QDY4_9AGAR|nr:hypothetical protein BDV98DRAFT_569511 [Pterula gracilis]